MWLFVGWLLGWCANGVVVVVVMFPYSRRAYRYDPPLGRLLFWRRQSPGDYEMLVSSVFLFHLSFWSQKCFSFKFLTNFRTPHWGYYQFAGAFHSSYFEHRLLRLICGALRASSSSSGTESDWSEPSGYWLNLSELSESSDQCSLCLTTDQLGHYQVVLLLIWAVTLLWWGSNANIKGIHP